MINQSPLMEPILKRMFLRGDSAFSPTWKFDDWTAKDVGFIFGYDARENLIKKAYFPGENEWEAVERPQRHCEKPRGKNGNT